MSSDFWTIHVWTAQPGREAELEDAWSRMAAARLEAIGGSASTLFRVADDPRVYYTPMRWPSRDAFEAWRSGEGRDGVGAVEAACAETRVVPLDTAREVRR